MSSAGQGGGEQARELPGQPPLTVTAPLLLRTHELSWEALEHLVVALAVQADHALESRPFGRGGQAQDGVDVVAFFASQPPAVYQAKRYEKFTAADLRKAVAAYTDGSRPFDAHRLVIVTTADVRDTKVDLELTRLREQHQDLVIDLWGRQQLSDMLFVLPDLVRRFFGEDTMRVFCRPMLDREMADISDASRGQALEDYLAHFGLYLSEGLHGLVGLTLEGPDGAEGVLSTELAAWLRPGRHVQVVGSSGTGKSHTLAHAAAGLAQDGWLPILLRAGVYEGRLEDSLDESVAPFTSQSADWLVRAARLEGLPVVLLVDAINECPSQLRDRLMLQLSSWCRRAEATLVSTSHEFVNVPAVIGGAQLRTVDPTSQQRAALLRCYGVGPQQEEVIEEECKAFGTAFELSMAAQLTRRLPTGAGRAALLDAYLGEQLQRASQPTALRQVLHRWAMLMDERLTGWLPLAEAQRSAAQVLVALGGAVGVVDEALRSPVVQVRHRRVEFRHEWYAQLLAAEALMWSRASAMELAGELRRPHRRELAVWAVALLSTPDEVRSLLQRLPDTTVLIEALCGRLGPVADGVALAEAQRCLEEAVEAMAASSVECSSEFEYAIEPRRCWSEYEQAMFTALGTTARDGRLLEPLARLMRENDQAFRRGTGWSPTRSRVAGLIAEALNGPIASTGGTQLPAAVITHALRLAWPRRGHNRHQPAGAADLQRWAASLEADDIGLAMLLCLLLRWTDDSEVAALAPALFSHAWATKASQLRFASLDLLTSIRTTVDEVTETRVIELLNDVHTDNVWVSTMLVDALHIYGQLTSPYAVDDITEEISSLLASPMQHDAHSRAQRIVESQFEEVISAPFVKAIDALEPTARRALLILAVREGDASLFTDVVLKELIRAKDPAALSAFRYWASHMNALDPFRQNAISCHLLGIEGCAAYMEIPPPMLGSHEGADAEAWRCYGQILFWLHRPNLDSDDRYARCMPLWEQLTTSLLDAAVDPLQQFQSVAMFAQDIRTSALGLIVDSFPGHIRTVLHHGLSAPEHLTSLFPHPQPDDRTATVLRLLARAGDHSSLQLLALYRDHPGLGGTATDTIRRLNNRTAES
ncbi:hypothetical protein WDH52_23060 [Streptomyces sp. TRM70308]|uniref:hypothetical protein n=1 Tax=Streptomyces sp. TRM70308 TaxID=3131932 RepID=UPI003D041070